MSSATDNIPRYSIGSVARTLNVSVQILRFYEAEGLILTEKSAGHQRLYSDADIDRIKCIQKAITELKISIGGLKKIYALIPCWDVMHCPAEHRATCPAFFGHSGGCWSYEHHSSACAGKNCRRCDVYTLSNNCEQIKELIVRSSNGSEEPI